MDRLVSDRSVPKRLALACAWLLLIGATSASIAAPQCTEGRTVTGECVNPALALNARRSAVVFAQPKLSATAFPVLPSLDRIYRYPHDLIFDPQRPAPLGPFRIINGKLVFSP
jgi:hypothetical protein